MKGKYASVLIVFIAVFTISASTYKNAPQPEGFKNLKVLPKNITEDELDSIMGNYSISLGVRCSFCHAADADTSKHHLDFASDSKPMKNTARKMMKMTAYLNENYFNDHADKKEAIHAVVCYTCHRGTKEPDANAFLAIIDSTMQAHRNRH